MLCDSLDRRNEAGDGREGQGGADVCITMADSC